MAMEEYKLPSFPAYELPPSSPSTPPVSICGKRPLSEEQTRGDKTCGEGKFPPHLAMRKKKKKMHLQKKISREANGKHTALFAANHGTRWRVP